MNDLSQDDKRVAVLTRSKELRGISPETLELLLEQVQKGDRNFSRSYISTTLHVNDVVAEGCLRHLEDRLKKEQDSRDRILREALALPSATASEKQKFLRDVFGVHGIVSNAILKNWRVAGA